MGITSISSGRIIMFDGPDGVGKTKQISRAAVALSGEGYTVHCTRVHGGTPFGEKLREVSLSDTSRLPLTDLFLSHTMHIELAHHLEERRQKGEICLVDRSPATMWSYQVRASGLQADIARPVIEKSFLLFSPDLLIIYITSADVLRQRIRGRHAAHKDYFENQVDDYQARTIMGYTEAAEMFQGHIIDASADADRVHACTMAEIAATLPKHER